MTINDDGEEGYGVSYDSNTTYINAATTIGGAKSLSRRKPIVFDYYPELQQSQK